MRSESHIRVALAVMAICIVLSLLFYQLYRRRSGVDDIPRPERFIAERGDRKDADGCAHPADTSDPIVVRAVAFAVQYFNDTGYSATVESIDSAATSPGDPNKICLKFTLKQDGTVFPVEAVVSHPYPSTALSIDNFVFDLVSLSLGLICLPDPSFCKSSCSVSLIDHHRADVDVAVKAAITELNNRGLDATLVNVITVVGPSLSDFQTDAKATYCMVLSLVGQKNTAFSAQVSVVKTAETYRLQNFKLSDGAPTTHLPRGRAP